jgi:hypothetical protein
LKGQLRFIVQNRVRELTSECRGAVDFSIMEGGHKAHSFDEEKYTGGTIGDMFERLKQDDYLLEKDIKGKKMTIRIDLWEGLEQVSSYALCLAMFSYSRVQIRIPMTTTISMPYARVPRKRGRRLCLHI